MFCVFLKRLVYIKQRLVAWFSRQRVVDTSMFRAGWGGADEVCVCVCGVSLFLDRFPTHLTGSWVYRTLTAVWCRAQEPRTDDKERGGASPTLLFAVCVHRTGNGIASLKPGQRFVLHVVQPFEGCNPF